jgi:iron complex outermembrane recepter protein
MMLGRIVVILAILLPWYQAAAQCTASLEGTVYDAASGEPLTGVIVFLNPGTKGTLTDSLGNFKIELLCPGSYGVRTNFLGYKEQTINLAIQNGVVRQEIRLRQDIKQLQEVVVTGQAQETEHAHNYSTLNEQQLAENAGKTLGETLKEITGVNTIQSGPGVFKPVIHGVHSQRVLILNYGIRQEGQQWGAEHAPEIDPFIASDIVVVKDASSIKYGTDALGGVIIVNPPSLPEKNLLAGSIHTVYQSNGRAGTISGLIEGGIGKFDGWGWRVQGTARRTGDFHTPDYLLKNTGVSETNFSAATGYHREKFGIEAFFSHFQSDIGILKGTAVETLDDLQAAMTRTEPLYTTDDFSYTISEPRQDVTHNLLKLNGHVLVQNGTLRLQYGFQNNQRKEYSLRIGDLSKIPTLNLQLNTHTIEAEFEKRFEEKRSLCIGLTGMYQQNSTVYGIQRIPFIPNFRNLSTGAYAIARFYFRRWTLDAGARYDLRDYSVSGYDAFNTLFHSKNDFHNGSASLGSTITLGKNSRLSMNLSSAWRPPHVSELYSMGKHLSAAAVERGLLLDPENNRVMDIDTANFKTENGLKWVTTYQKEWRSFAIEISPYVNYIFNYIYLKPDGVSSTLQQTAPAFRYTQTDASFIGIDLSARWTISNYFTASPKISLLRAKDETNDDYLIYIPANRYELNFRYERPLVKSLRKFFVESRLRYTDKQRRAPRTISPSQFGNENEDPLAGSNKNYDFMAPPDGYALWNLTAGISFKRKETQYDLRVSSENTLNTTYREYTNRMRYYADDLGRNLIVSLKFIF